MKIGFLYDAVYPWIKGGGEKTLYELACELRNRGHECHFFGMHCWDGPRDFERDGLHYHAVCPNVPLYGSDGKRRISQPLRFAWGVLTQLRRYDLNSFDLFDVHAFPFFSVPAFWFVRLVRARRLPWLLTWLEVWGRDYWRRYLGAKGIIGAWLERWCAWIAPHHLCISPTTGRRLQQLLGVDAKRISVIPRGFVAPSDALPAGRRDPLKVVVAGRLISYKQVDRALRAWTSVVEALSGARLHVIGDGPEATNLRQLQANLGLAESVSLHGQLARREDVLEAIASAALLLQPSLREGQSTVVLEALTLGTPVLAATGPETAVGDFLGDEATTSAARLPEDATPAAWAERIVTLLRDDQARTALVDAGRRQVAQLGWREFIAPQVEALYHRLVDVNACEQRPAGTRLHSDRPSRR